MMRKRITGSDRFASQLKFGIEASDGLHANYFADESGVREPFALMHRVHG